MKCEVDGCDTPEVNVKRSTKYGGCFCGRHMQQLTKRGKIVKIKKSCHDNTNKKVCCFCGKIGIGINFEGENYCRRHYDHMRLFGECKKRTIFEKNEIIKLGDYAEVVLYNIKGEEVARTKVDLDDVEKISEYKWNLGSHGYPINTVNAMCIHSLIMESLPNRKIDHKNRDELDNRKENLRYCTSQENSFNKSLRENLSGVSGVAWDRNNRRWVATLTKGEIKRNQRCDTLEQAIKLRLTWEQELMGEFAPQKHLFLKYLSDDNISIEVKNKVKKAVVNLDTGEVFESIKEASEKYNTDITSISNVCKGKREKTKGFRWSFAIVDKNGLLEEKESPTDNAQKFKKLREEGLVRL